MPVPRVVRWLSLLYPPSIRRAHRREMLADLAESWQRRRGTGARVGLVCRLVADAAASWGRPAPRTGRRAAAVAADLRLALKGLRSHPASMLGTASMCVVGIGLATTMFALSDPFLLRPLPYAHADRLALIEVDPLSALGVPGQQADVPLLAEWQARTDLFDGLAAYTRHGTLRVRVGGRVLALETMAVSANLFEVLGVPGFAMPATPGPYDDEVWVTPQGARGLLGTTDLASGMLPLQTTGALQVRGVLPRSFLMPQEKERRPVDALVELAPGPIVERLDLGGGGFSARHVTMIGRLRDNVAPGQVEAALNSANPRGLRLTVRPLVRVMKAQQRPLALGALAAGLLVLVVCAANALGMALTRGLSRAHRIATMEVLGARRGRIARLLLFEAVAVAASGLSGALLAMPLMLEAISAMVPRSLVVLGTPVLSWRVAAFAGIASLLACVAWWVGSLAAWQRGARMGLRATAARDGHMVRVVRFGLIVGQVAATLVLLAGAGLLGRSYLNLVGQDTGMDGNALAVSASYGPELEGAALRDTIERTTAEFRRQPGVRAAAAVVGQMADEFTVSGLIVIGRPWPVERLWVSSDYFETTGMSFIEGHAPSGPGSGAVVNGALVSRYLDGRAAIGDLIRVGNLSVPIVGIVKDSRRRALDEPSGPAAFLPLDDRMTGMRVTYLMAGTNVAAATWESIIHRGSPDAVILDGATLRARLARTIQDRSFAMVVVSLFAAATVAVTAAGLVGVVGYVVARRTREVGIRVALGARPWTVTWLMMRDALAAAVTGATAGLVGALWLSGLMTSLVYQVSPHDGITLAAATAGLIALAAVAASVPARRAGRLSPTAALREE